MGGFGQFESYLAPRSACYVLGDMHFIKNELQHGIPSSMGSKIVLLIHGRLERGDPVRRDSFSIEPKRRNDSVGTQHGEVLKMKTCPILILTTIPAVYYGG